MSYSGDVQGRITSWFLEKLNLEIPAVETDLFETGVLDSLGFVELVLHLEHEFGITIALDHVEVDNFRSIARIAAFVGNGAGVKDASGVEGHGVAEQV